MITRGLSLLAIFICCFAVVLAKPAWGPHHHKGAKTKRPSGENDLAHGDIDFDSLSPKDCASYLCPDSLSSATAYIESGCPGPFALFQHEDTSDMPELATTFEDTYDEASGVTTTTLLALAAASGVFSAGIGFIAGYKSSPSFAYMRIPSLV